MWSSDAQVTRLSLRVDGSGVVLASVKKIAKGLMSKPTNRRPQARDSTAVVPPPTNGSNTMSSLAGQVINDGGSQVWVQARKISVGLVCQTVDVLTLSIGCPDSAHQIPSLCSPDSGPVAAAVQGRRSTRGSVSVSRAQPPMCLSCPLVGCGRSIPPDHLRTAPASQAHQVGLVASVHLPEVSERVPELVREQPRNACLDSAFSDQLKDVAISQLPCPTQPHRLNVSLRVERANANVSVNSLSGLRPLPSTRAVASLRSTSETFKPASSPRLIPVSSNRRMMARSRRSANAWPAQTPSSEVIWSSVRTAGGTSGTIGGLSFAIGETSVSPSLKAHFRNCCSERNSSATVAGRTSDRRLARYSSTFLRLTDEAGSAPILVTEESQCPEVGPHGGWTLVRGK